MSFGGGGFAPGPMFGGLGGQGGQNLPFAGVPEELREKVDRVLEDEPEIPRREIEFDPEDYDRRPFGLWRFLAPHKFALGGALGLVVLETLALQAGPLLTKIAIDSGIRAGKFDVLVGVALTYLVLIGITILTSRARIIVTTRVGADLMVRLRVRLFTHLQRLSLGFFTQEKGGVLFSRMTSDPMSLAQLFHEGLVQLAVQIFTLLVVTAFILTLNVKLALILLLSVIPAMTVMTLWFRSASADRFLAVRDRIADVLAHLQENLAGIRTVTAFNRNAYNTVEHRNIVGDYREANEATSRVNALYGPGSEMVGILGQSILFFVGGNMVLQGELTVGDLAAFILYLTAFFSPIQQLVQLYSVYQQGGAAVVKLREFLAVAPEVRQKSEAYELPPIHGAIELENLDFSYAKDQQVLENLNLQIRPGETFALVGSTGSGKSTIAKLVSRFYEPDRGSVRIDGHDLRDITFRSLRSQVGVIPQEPFLFASSVRDNVAFARPDATDDEVLDACRAVGVIEQVQKLPEGIHTMVHERGVTLSAGERQLLALARAFLAEPRLLVLDEATSNLDLRSEARIEQALDILLEGRTAIIIAHRMATAQRADRIGVVDDGRIVEIGTHEELIFQKGRYAAMFETWAAAGAAERE
ncbi:MAG: ABC transporter ATP-binding protein [Candidatus Binatia bacterium]|nr:ABC transporter ATP-binding protein [Candidatus Binatia bacterium]MDG2009356.1 ABC transporter ATP-binding protein [Candidatus Binatia bacterium]